MRIRTLLITAFLSASSALAAISGTVINSDGQPVAGAKVSMYAPETLEARRVRLMSTTPERAPLATRQTDSRGNFSFDTPKEPVVDLRIEAVGFAPDALRLLSDDESGAIALMAAPTQKGTITSNGKPVAGATVVWSGAAEYATTTDADGHYNVPDPNKWANRIVVIHPDFAIFEESALGFGRSTARLAIDRSLNPGVAINGRVMKEDGQTPAAKAAIFVNEWPLATSGDDGTFTVAHAPKDWRELEARAGTLAGLRAHSSSSTTIRLAKSPTVTGVVRDARSQTALAGADVRLAQGGPFAAAAASRDGFTDAKGNFTITAPPGSYELMMTRPGSVASPVTVSLMSGKAVQKSIYANQRARVVGSVLDEDKRAVAGARISARPASREPMMMGPRMFGQDTPAAVSGPDGRFVLRNVITESDLQVDAAKKGFPTGRSASLRLNPGERKSGVVITIPRGVAFSGKVTDADGRPLSGVEIEAVDAVRDPGGGMMRRMISIGMRGRSDDFVRTGSDGTFIVRLKEGTYDVGFKREGFAVKSLRAQTVNATTKPVTVTLEPGVEISGRVTRAGVGVEGVNVSAMTFGAVETAVTAPDGSFRISDLTPGSTMLSVNKMDAFIQQIRPVTAPARDLAIELPAGGRITGRVIDKTTKSPIASFQAGVSMSRSGGGMAISMPPMLRSFTSDDGTFALENVPAGPTQVVVIAPGYTTARVPGVNVEEGKSVTDLEVGLDTGARVTGRVTGSDGSPLSGVVVRMDTNASPSRGMRFDATNTNSVTDPNGEYTLEAVETGDQTFAFSRQGYLTESRTINVAGKDARLDVQLSSGIRLTGTVVTDAGVPVADAMVRAMSSSDPSFGKEARTDSNGSFQIEGAAPGHYNLAAAKSGYADGILRDFDASTGAPARIIMAVGAVITGHVTGLTDRELQQATVTATTAGSGSTSTPVDANGNYRIDGAPSGTVRLIARTGQGLATGSKTSPVKSIQVDPGASVQADLEFIATVIRGRVTHNGQPVTSSVVHFMPRNAQAQTSANATTDSNGSYEVGGLDDASYNVQVIDLQRTSPYNTTYDVHGSGSFDIDIKAAPVRGSVIDATTGAPIEGAQVLMQSAVGEAFLTSRGGQSNPSGVFVIDNVAQGSYQVKAEKEGYGHDVQTITVGDNGVDSVVFKLSPSSGVTLHVVDGRDQRPIGADVTRIVDGAGREIDTGSFRFGGGPEPIKLALSPGSYRVTLTSMGYAPRTVTITSPSEPTVALTPGGTVILRSKSSTLLRARLVDSNGMPYTRGPFRNPIFTIDPSPGVTTLNNIAGGTYQLQILDGADRAINTINVTVIDGQQVQVDV